MGNSVGRVYSIGEGVSPVSGDRSSPSSSSARAGKVTDAPGCPIDHSSSSKPSSSAPSSSSSTSASAATCPIDHGGASAAAAAAAPAPPRSRGTVYNVYSQPIDPSNQMPATAAQAPSPGQTKPLSTNRVQATIQKGGTDGTWTYPSPQMFWNALVRKGKADGVSEDDMDSVVSIHNEMNERAWAGLLTWEALHAG